MLKLRKTNYFLLIAVLLSLTTYLFITFDSSPEKTSKNTIVAIDKISVEAPQTTIDETNFPKPVTLTQKFAQARQETHEVDDDYIVDCTKLAFSRDKKEKADLEQQFSNYIHALSQSDVPVDKYIELIQQPRDEKTNNLQLYFELLNEAPLNKHIYVQTLQSCVENFDQSICNNELYQKATHIDNDNALLWHTIALIKYGNGNIEGAVESLREANKKSEYNEYYFEKLSLVKHSMKEYSTLNFAHRFTGAWGITAASRSNLISIFKFCKSNLIHNIEIADICLQVGKHLETQSKTQLTSLIGLNLQKEFHKFHKNHLVQATLEEKIQKVLRFTRSPALEKATALLFFDEELARNWINTSLNKGEQIGMEQLVSDAILYSKNEHYNPCPATNE